MGLTSSFYFFRAVFDALNDGENLCKPRFHVGGEIHWVESRANGTKLDFGFFAALVAIESEHRKGLTFFNPLKANAHFAATVGVERCQPSPTAVEVGEGHAQKNGSAAASASVRDGICFEPTQLVEGLRAATDRHEFIDSVAGAAGFASEATATHAAMRGGDAIQCVRTVAEDFLMD